MKKIISILLAAILMAGCLSACTGKEDKKEQSETEEDKIKIVTTIFPEYDWVMNILGENPANAEVTLLLDSGTDLHSYQPTAEDIKKIAECDLFIYVGGESDEWAEDAIKEASGNDMRAVNLLDVLGEGVKEEETVEGMQEEDHDHDHEDADKEHDHDKDEKEYDEHVWLSLRNASVLVTHISEELQKIDSDNAEVYKANTSGYAEKLAALDKEYESAVSKASVKTLLFGDRFPFRYLVDDYGLSYFAAFAGCSAESEASFETIAFLAKKVDELGLSSVMTIEGKDHKIAGAIIDNTKTKDQKILTMDSMQSTTAKDIKDGASYLSVMENNLSVLKEALK